MEEVKIEQGKEEFPKEFSVAFKRWIVREIRAGRVSMVDTIERFEFNSKDPRSLINNWLKRYSGDLEISLPVMTEKEKARVEALNKRIKDLENQLEHAQMKYVALNTLIDVAEESLKITIRKKAGAKQ
jgi:transposase